MANPLDVTEPPPLVTEVPLTAEAREQLIDGLFADELPHQGEIFVPDDNFYHGGSSHKKAEHMVKLLCGWLGLKPGYIGLEFESGKTKVPDGSRYTIYLEASTLSDEFVLGGYLALALTRYLVEERKQIHLPDVGQQATLLASASIVFGLGLVVANGISPAYNWISQSRDRHTRLLKDFPVPNYSQMTLNFLRKYRIDSTVYSHSLAPWALKRMGLAVPSRPSHAVRDARHRARLANVKIVGFCWVLVLVLGIGGFAYAQRVRPLPAGAHEASQKADLLNQLAHICKDSLAYDRQYTDQGDIQSQRALNAEALRCQSLQNQSDAARQRSDALMR